MIPSGAGMDRAQLHGYAQGHAGPGAAGAAGSQA